MSKGCGCQTGVFSWLRPPYGKKFHDACVRHDDAYDNGGRADDRKAADLCLFWRMVGMLVGETQCPWQFAWFTLVALLYYASVRTFGRFYFNYQQNEKKDEDSDTQQRHG